MSAESRRLLDYWLPPEGSGRALACLATTFTFEPDFFEAECLSRFLGLDAKRGESRELDLALLIHQEERLAETRVSVVVDRSQVREGRSLRWDVLPVGIESGVQHAKVAVLVWEQLVRVLVTSANLTENAYRYNVETGVALDALPGGRLPGSMFLTFLSAVREIVDRAPGSTDRPGPKVRALATLDAAAERIATFGLPTGFPSGVRLAVVMGAPERPLPPQVALALRGGPPRTAVVMSPFFDVQEKRSLAGEALIGLLAQRGPLDVTFVVPLDTMDARTILRAPPALLKAVPDRAEVVFRPFRQLKEDEVRRLHGKAILLKNNRWTTVLVGSSNFTVAGLALNRHRANLEINVAFTTRSDSREAKALRELFSAGDPMDPSQVEWEPEEDAEDVPGAVLPWGFLECLLHPERPMLEMTFERARLPEEWTVTDPISGSILADNTSWVVSGRPDRLEVTVRAERFPLFLEVAWEVDGEHRKAGWAVNVTEPGKLPPPEELRDLPAQALLRALASTRPIHESLAKILADRERTDGGTGDELDPLKRYSGTGRLLARARQVSAALSGLKERLQRPLGSMDALEWRLRGPLGPVALAESLTKEAEGGRLLNGEGEFLLGELALTVARVDWDKAAGSLDPKDVRKLVTRSVADLRGMRGSGGGDIDSRLKAYVDRAFRAARP